MKNYFDTKIAEAYDAAHDSAQANAELDDTIRCLKELAADGPVLEFAIGTGRVALPLAKTGLDLSGIEYSEAMLDVLRRKPGAEKLTLVQGDMAHTRVDGAFSLVVLVFNTIGNLVSQDAQVACFENAARHLQPGGRFVIEMYIPPLRRFPPGAPGVPFSASAAHSGIDTIDTSTQQLVSHHYARENDGSIGHEALPQRYVWPSEMDLMARIAGMDLEHRWGGWDGREFDGESDKHISVWRKRK